MPVAGFPISVVQVCGYLLGLMVSCTTCWQMWLGWSLRLSILLSFDWEASWPVIAPGLISIAHGP